MKNYNFILTKQTAGIFIIRFKKLLSVTGCISSQSEYTGKQEISGWLTSIGLKRGKCYFNPVVRTTKGYFLQVTELFSTNEGVLIRSNNYSDGDYTLKYGTKIKFTSNSFKFTSTRQFYASRKENGKVGIKCTFAVFGNIQRAEARIDMNKRYAEDYEKDMEYYMKKDMEEEEKRLSAFDGLDMQDGEIVLKPLNKEEQQVEDLPFPLSLLRTRTFDMGDQLKLMDK